MPEEITCDAYAMGVYKDCEQKYNLRINRGLVSKGRGGGSRGFGSAMHKAREMWRLSLMRGDSDSHALEQGLIGLRDEFALMSPVSIAPDERKTLANAELLFRGYTAKFVRHNYKPITIETPFSVDAGTTAGGRVVKRTGIMDEYCEFNGLRYVLDLKTSAIYPGGSWMDVWRTSEQLLGYVYAARALYGSCAGAIIHGIWVHTPPKTTRNKYKLEDYFTAEIINFSDAQIDEWQFDFLASIDRREEARASGHWSPNLGSACKSVYGLCDYFKWCSSTPEIRPQIEQIYYERQAWQELSADRLGTVTPIIP